MQKALTETKDVEAILAAETSVIKTGLRAARAICSIQLANDHRAWLWIEARLCLHHVGGAGVQEEPPDRSEAADQQEARTKKVHQVEAEEQTSSPVWGHDRDDWRAVTAKAVVWHDAWEERPCAAACAAVKGIDKVSPARRPGARAELMAAFLSTAKSASPPLLQIMLDRFGNYIVQRVIETSMGAEKEEARSDGVCWAKGHERDAADSGRNFAEERARPGRLELQVPGHGVGRAKGKGIRGLWIDAWRLQAVHGGYLLVGPRSWRQEGGQATISAVEEGWVISDESGARVRGSGDAPHLAFRWQILEDGGWHDAARFRVATYCAQVVNVDSQECLQHSAVSVQNVLLRGEKVTHVELANEEVETRAVQIEAPTEPSAESRPGSPDDVQRSQSWDNSLQGSVHMPQDLRDRVTMEVHRLLCRAQMEVAVSQVDLDVLVEECCHSLVIMCHGPIDDQLLQREVLRVVLRGWERARLHDSPYSSPLTRQTHTRGVGRLQSEEGPVSQAALHVEEPAECQSQVMIGCQVLPCRSAPGGNEATDGCQIS
ncbi:unnamed protein product [Effrenium voratum]|nr:unnamed protein product [Effrenium voratum]